MVGSRLGEAGCEVHEGVGGPGVVGLLRNGAVAALAREGGLPSTLWAGPEGFGRAVRSGEYPVQGTVRRKPVALRLGVPFVPVRKRGKLPHTTRTVEYDLEYGTAAIEVHVDAVAPGQRVLVVDDVLATGGTAAAACDLVEQLGGVVAGVAFLMELTFLDGRDRLPGRPLRSLVRI